MNGPGITFYPTFYYRDARAAMSWLERVFGFSRHLVVDGDDGSVAHAELRLGDAFIMCGSLGNLEARDPRGVDRAGCAAVYVSTLDIRAHYDRAVAQGATITLPYEEKDYGGAGYSAHDLEGNEWSFGSYRPTPS